jgi:hypothetical protein
MKNMKLLAAAGVLSLTLVSSAAPGGAQPASSSGSQVKWSAAIIPSLDMAVGSALPYGPSGSSAGWELSANGVNNWLTTCSNCTYDFVFFVFSNEAHTATVTFHVTSPSGAEVYQYSWPSDKLPQGATWFLAYAKGDYSGAGTYQAYVEGTASGSSVLLGSTPLVLTPPSSSGGSQAVSPAGSGGRR